MLPSLCQSPPLVLQLHFLFVRLCAWVVAVGENFLFPRGQTQKNQRQENKSLWMCRRASKHKESSFDWS